MREGLLYAVKYVDKDGIQYWQGTETPNNDRSITWWTRCQDDH